MIFLYILALLVLIIIALLFIRLRIIIKYDKKPSFEISWLFFKIFSTEKNKAKKKNISKNQKKKSNPDEKKTGKNNKSSLKKFFSDFLKAKDFGETLDVIKQFLNCTGKLLKSLYSHLVFSKLIIRGTVSGTDPADTAKKYGEICSICFPVASFVISNSTVKDYEININPDFIYGTSDLFSEADITVRPVFILSASIAYLFRLIFKIFIKKAVTENERKNSSRNVGNNN